MRASRTFLFAPGTDSYKIEKAFALPADSVILDLEDAVPPERKAEARAVVRESVRASRGLPTFVRVNGVSTDYFRCDMEEVFGAGLDGIMLPKAESGDEIRVADGLISEAEDKLGSPPGRVELIPLVESAVGVHRAAEIAGASPRVSRLAFGSLDFALDVGATWDPDGTTFLYARSHLVVVSRVAGVGAPIDAVFPDLDDDEGFVRECEQARRLGFQGKLVIHPRQIEPANRAFSPSPEEIAQARRIVSAFEEAERKGLASIQVDGKLVDYPIALRARKLLETVHGLGLD